MRAEIQEPTNRSSHTGIDAGCQSQTLLKKGRPDWHPHMPLPTHNTPYISAMQRLSQAVVRFKWPILILTLALTAFFGYQLQYIKVNSNVVDALPETDPVVQVFREVGDKFGSNQIGLVVVEADNVFTPDVLDDIEIITDTLTEIEGVVGVRSITNMRTFQSQGDDFQIDDLINRSRLTGAPGEVDSLQTAVTSNDLVKGSLVAENASSTIVLFYFDVEADVKAVASTVMTKIDRLDLPENIYYGGSTFLTTYVADIIRTDMILLIPIAFVLIALILFLSFRSIQGVILPLLSAALAIIWAVGTFSWLGFELSMVSNNVPIIVLAVGSAYAIHVFNRIHQSPEGEKLKAVAGSLAVVALPVIMSGLTTVVGFVSFVFGAYLTMIRDFGILAALGTLFSTLLALFFVPALLAVLPRKNRSSGAGDSNISTTGKESFMSRRILMPLFHINVNYPQRIIRIWGLLIIVGLIGVFMLERSVSVADYFKKSHPASLADKVLEADYGGSKPVFAVFKGDVQSPEMLSAMDDFATYLKASPYVTSTQSISDVVIKLNDALSEDKGVPEEKGTIQQLWFFLGQQDLSQLITEDLDEAVLMAKFNNEGQANTSAFDQYVEEWMQANASEDFEVQITGMPYVNAQLDSSLVRSQLTSLLLAVILVILLVSLIFRSFVEGLFASTPIIATIVIMYGIMGLTGIPLNVVTVLVASVAMGIGIDYSIHYISNFNQALEASGSISDAVRSTIMVSGKAIFINFISVSAGFIVLIFSDLMPMVYFGILIALSMLGSAMGALTLLPAIIIQSRRRKLITR